MLGEEDKGESSEGNRRTYSRSISWTDRLPRKSNSRPLWNSKARACLPPLHLSIAKPKVEEWPSAGSDDLGIWPSHPPTPGVRQDKVNENPCSAQTPNEFRFKKDKLAFFDKECSRIIDHIYLGSEFVAKNREILRANGITHVLNCVGFVCPEYFKNDLVYKTLWLQDSPAEDITSILYDVFDYFEDVREQEGRVLVHCCQGVSRSTSLVIAYLMWKEGQSFEDAFQHVKTARGVTNPNMGFACQLLQCQKRVHATPASPSSALRMYRMAPHSSYDPLHLVPKMLSNPSVEGLDSRGAFVVHVPSALYVWIGNTCVPIMSENARAAASQVMRYEMAQGPIQIIKEGEEPCEFWDVLGCGCFLADGCIKAEETMSSAIPNGMAGGAHLWAGQRKVDSYDLDFDIFHEALAGGVVPPFPSPEIGYETRLPARENGWSKLRRKFSRGIMKKFITSSKLHLDVTQFSHTPDVAVHPCVEENPASPMNLSSASSPRCDSPDSFSSFVVNSPKWMKDTCGEEKSHLLEQFSLPVAPCNSSDSFSSCFSNRKFYSTSTSPSLSPSTSDYSGSFTLSPSSSNWSDLSVQPSPSGLESTDRYHMKDLILEESSCIPCKTNSTSAGEAFSACHAPGVVGSCGPCRGISPSIAVHRGSNVSLVMFPSVGDSSQLSANIARSWSFSLAGLEDDAMKDAESKQVEQDGSCDMCREETPLDTDILSTDVDVQRRMQTETENGASYRPSSKTTLPNMQVTGLVLYQWPSMHKVETHCFGALDSRRVYIILMRNAFLELDDSDALYIWVGRDVPLEETQNQLFCSDKIFRDNFQWETDGHNFLKQNGLNKDIPFQMVREGEEPEYLMKHLHRLLFNRH